MKELDYYLSVTVDPEEEIDDFKDSLKLQDMYEVKYKIDSIVSTIGTSECKQNMNLFWKDIEELDFTTKQKFTESCLERIVSFYKLDLLNEFFKNFSNFDNLVGLKLMLEFLECGKCVDVLSPYMEQNLQYNCQNIREEIKNKKGTFSNAIYYFITLSSDESLNDFLGILLKKYKTDFRVSKILN